MRTRKQGLTAMIKAYKAGKLGSFGSSALGGSSCLYKDRAARTCIVGCLFNDAQVADIRKRGLNGARIAEVARKIGRQNIVAVTGLQVYELTALQELHDEPSQRKNIIAGALNAPLYRKLEKMLAKA